MKTKHCIAWQNIREEARHFSDKEAVLASYFHEMVLKHNSLEQALASLLAGKLASTYVPRSKLQQELDLVFAASPEIGSTVQKDLLAITSRDPAAQGLAEPFLHFKGFHALQAYRVSHYLWQQRRFAFATYLQGRVSEVLSVDIHPAAKIGSGILMDHATGVVIGETAIIGNDVSILHEVTLGGTGKEHGDRHPKVGNGVLIGAGAKILGNIRIGEGSKIGAGSVVLNEVPPHCTVAGAPARIVGHPKSKKPALSMDHSIESNSKETSSYSASML